MKTILIIEDDREILELLSDILEMEDYEVLTAVNGKLGVSKAYEKFPDLIICDIMMPEMDGYEVLRHIRSNPQTFGTPFLFLTAKADKSDLRHGMELGPDDYITKPFENKEILSAIRTR
ncbi:MAG: response regulator transcription factor, partial [Candidatus Kapaibacterium sp.]